MTLDFSPITLPEKPGDNGHKYLELLRLSPSLASDYSLSNIWGWAGHYGLEWAFCDKNLAWIRQTKPTVRYWAPVGSWDETPWHECCLEPGTEITRVPEDLAKIWQKARPDQIELKEERGSWDYVYLVEELATLKGPRFHKKKNHYNRFLKLYNWEYRSMKGSDVEEVLDMQEDWVKWQEDPSPSLTAENKAVARVLSNWDKLPGLIGGLIYIDGRLEAYTVGESLAPDSNEMIVIHFEKASTEFRGLYQAINAMFLQNDAKNFKYVNREQDLDDPGLRKSKESYNPVDYIKKQIVYFHK